MLLQQELAENIDAIEIPLASTLTKMMKEKLWNEIVCKVSHWLETVCELYLDLDRLR